MELLSSSVSANVELLSSRGHATATLTSPRGQFSPAVSLFFFLNVAVPGFLQQMADRQRAGCGGRAEVCKEGRQGKSSDENGGIWEGDEEQKE